MAKTRTVNYRKIYEDYYRITIPEGMDIHHIDGNRDNNNIENLLMLPKDLHERYHFWKRELDGIGLKNFNGLLQDFNQYYFAVLAEFGKVCNECLKWMSLKTQLGMRKWCGDLNG